MGTPSLQRPLPPSDNCLRIGWVDVAMGCSKFPAWQDTTAPQQRQQERCECTGTSQLVHEHCGFVKQAKSVTLMVSSDSVTTGSCQTNFLERGSL
jgi:hypothetical protein